MIKKLFLVGIFFVSLLATSSLKAEVKKVEKPYFCQYTSTPIKVDGFLKESAWQKAEPLNFILLKSHKEPLSKAEGKILWDKDYLYVGIRAEDKDIWGYYSKRDDPTCREDVLEIFFKTELEKENYYNFEINALNTVYDAFDIRRQTAGGSYRWRKWNCPGLKSAVRIKGTLNNWEDRDKYWVLEVAIPFSSLPTLRDKSPKNLDVWSFHLARYDYSIYLPEGRELTSCAPLSKVNFHYYEDWLPLIFVD